MNNTNESRPREKPARIFAKDFAERRTTVRRSVISNALINRDRETSGTNRIRPLAAACISPSRRDVIGILVKAAARNVIADEIFLINSAYYITHFCQGRRVELKLVVPARVELADSACSPTPRFTAPRNSIQFALVGNSCEKFTAVRAKRPKPETRIERFRGRATLSRFMRLAAKRALCCASYIKPLSKQRALNETLIRNVPRGDAWTLRIGKMR